MWTGGQNDQVSSHNSWPPWKCLYHSNSVDHLNASLPNATIRRLLSFLSNFSCFVTNFIQMCYSAISFYKNCQFTPFLQRNNCHYSTTKHVRTEWTIPTRSSLLDHTQSLHSHQKFLERGFLHSPRNFWTDIHTYGVNLDRRMLDRSLFTTMNQWFKVKHYQEEIQSVMLQMPHIQNHKLQIIALLTQPSFTVHSSAYHTGLSPKDWLSLWKSEYAVLPDAWISSTGMW